MSIAKSRVNIREHVFDTITRVLLRPRFGIEINEIGEDWDLLKFSKDGFDYKMFVGSHKNKIYMTVHVSGSESPFFKTHWMGDYPNLRKIGITLANKVKMKQFHFVSDS